MNPTLTYIIVMGITATVLLDLWALVAKKFGMPTADWGIVGRWVGHMPKGRYAYSSIVELADDSKKIKYEKIIGWVFHYAVGIFYAAIYYYLTIKLANPPTVYNAVAFGLATVIAPWFIMQPGMGLGVMARLSPKKTIIRLYSLSAHTVFGIGLFLGYNIAYILVLSF